MNRLYLLLAIALPVTFGCDTRPPAQGSSVVAEERSDNPPVVDIDDKDREMSAAIARARATVDRFIAALQNPSPTQEDFAVKLLVEDGDVVEHMWLTPVELRGDRFVGTLNNEPRDLTNVQLGDELSVAKDEVSDWMYVDNGRIAGGYSIRVLIDKAPPEQREAMSKAMKFVDE